MKRVIKIGAVLIILAILGSACNQYVCPAYATDTEQEQSGSVDQS